MRGLRRGSWGVFGTALVVCGAIPATASGVTASEVLASLNAQRSAHAIPAGIVEEPQWSADCAAHNEYQRRNGGSLTHTEEPGKPGYTPGGADAAAKGVLASGLDWRVANPFEDGPFHLHQTLAPRLSRMGAAQDGSEPLICATTLKGLDRPASREVVTYTYPGSGSGGFRLQQVADEVPYTPGERVGIPRGTVTGPYLLLSFDGPWTDAKARLGEVTLTGPGGPLEVRTVDNFTSGLETLLPTGGQVIPIQPLQAGTHRLVVAAAISDGQTTWNVRHGYDFVAGGEPVAASPSPPTTVTSVVVNPRPGGTGGGANQGTTGPGGSSPGSGGGTVTGAGVTGSKPLPATAYRLRIAKPRSARGRVSLVLEAGPGLVGRRARIAFTPAGRRTAIVRRIVLRARQTVRFKGRRGRVVATVSPFAVGTTRYGAIKTAHRFR